MFRENKKEAKKKEEKKEKIENGAHNHLSQLQKLRASKYSRHVVLCKKTKKTKKTKLNHVVCKKSSYVNRFKTLFDTLTKYFERREKKTEHTNISHTTRNSERKIFTSCCLMQK